MLVDVISLVVVVVVVSKLSFSIFSSLKDPLIHLATKVMSSSTPSSKLYSSPSRYHPSKIYPSFTGIGASLTLDPLLTTIFFISEPPLVLNVTVLSSLKKHPLKKNTPTNKITKVILNSLIFSTKATS